MPVQVPRRERESRVTRDEQRVYARGYQRGYKTARERHWPDYRPPTPPNEFVAAIMRASEKLADHVATWSGAFGEDDEFSLEMKPLLDAVDKAHCDVTRWLEQPVSEEG